VAKKSHGMIDEKIQMRLRVIGLWNVIGVGDVYKRARSKMNEAVGMLDGSAFGVGVGEGSSGTQIECSLSLMQDRRGDKM